MIAKLPESDEECVEAPPGATRVQREAVVPDGSGGSRADQAAAELFAEFSRSRIAEWIRAGALRVDGCVVKPKQTLAGGERLTLDVMLEAQIEMRPEDIALDLLYEDEHVLVVNKPAGLVVHPGAGNPSGTLQNALLHHDARLAEIPRAGIVHRLDKDTSGALVVARTLQAHAALVAQLAEREVHRQYEALVQGTMVAGGTVDAPIDRHPRDRLKMAVRENGRPAVTHYRVREKFSAHTLLQVQLETGRTHQIRVHMAYIRHPIVGDPLYGAGLRLPRGAGPDLVAALREFKRQALHAERLEFEHPVGAVAISVTAPRPRDLEAVLIAMRNRA
ncbi:MAG TPA: 23S rRNA pseudouridine(1911/1915/1917) synthase RluD [Candidatus Saccharimonadia bacterium]|nr:23S rRNA pseudouridine(1911/1915/1917) synthase RluD [Candidatus Saccharimonadia bacterium]